MTFLRRRPQELCVDRSDASLPGVADDLDSHTQTPVLALLRGRFGWFYFGRSIDLAGSSMTTTALALAVLQASRNPTDLGIVLAANLVPMLALLLIGGGIADRVSRRKLLIVSNMVSGIAMAGMAATFIAGSFALPIAAGLSLVTGAASAFTSPALRGIVPELVRSEDMQRANAMLASTRNAVRILAPAVAGILVASVGGGWALAVDAASYILASLAYTRIPPLPPLPASSEPLWRTLAEGWGTFRRLRWVVTMTISFALINAFNVGPWNVLGPTVVTQHDGAVGWGVVQAVRAAGLLVASVLAIKLVLRRPMRDGRLWGALAAAPLLALALSGHAWVVAIAAAVGGFGFTLAGLTWETKLQTAIPKDQLSRVGAYDDLFSFIAIPFSQVAVGPLSATFGAPRILLVCGIAYVLASLFPLLNRAVRTDAV